MNSDHDVNDLLSDVSFRNWVLHQDSESGLFWKNWLIQNPGKKEAVAEARIILKSLQFNESKLSEKESAQLLKRIKDTNASREKNNSRKAIVRPINNRVKQTQHQQNRRKSSVPYLFRYAAILIVALIFALSVHLVVVYWKNEAGVQLVEKVNEKGQKATLFLSDGSVVVLNASSTLLYPKEFTGDTRGVYLKGEAFFKVTRSSKPFIVKTDKLEAKVLGTSFNVNAFPGTQEPSVSLVTGKVMINSSEDDQQYLMLEPGEKGKIDHAAGKLVKTIFDYEEEIAWKEGVLLFKDLPFEEALSRMEQWYGVEFITDHMPQQDYYVTGRFDKESLENVLQSIGFTIAFNYRIEGNKVYLTFNK